MYYLQLNKSITSNFASSNSYGKNISQKSYKFFKNNYTGSVSVSEVKILSLYSSSLSALPRELNSAASTTPHVNKCASNLTVESDCIGIYKKPCSVSQNLQDNLKRHPKGQFRQQKYIIW